MKNLISDLTSLLAKNDSASHSNYNSASLAQIKDAEERLNISLPLDVIEFYKVFNVSQCIYVSLDSLRLDFGL